jgi:hypothetical protein
MNHSQILLRLSIAHNIKHLFQRPPFTSSIINKACKIPMVTKKLKTRPISYLTNLISHQVSSIEYRESLIIKKACPTIYPQKIVIDFFAPADYYICNIDSLSWRIWDSKTISGRIRKCARLVAVAPARKKQRRKRPKRKPRRKRNSLSPQVVACP